MKAPIINSAFLKKYRACDTQRRKFSRVFGKDGAPLTVANAIKATKAGLSLEWLAYACVMPHSVENKICDKADKSPAGKALAKVYRDYDRATNKLSDKIYARRVALADPYDGPYSFATAAAMKKDPECKALRKQEARLEQQYRKDRDKAQIARNIVYARLIVPEIRKYWENM